MPRLPLVCLALAAALSFPLQAQTTEAEIGARLVNKPLYLRGLWRSDKLKFDGNGALLGSSKVGSFTVSGVRVEKIVLKGGSLLLEGVRAGIQFTNGLPERVILQQGPHDEKVRIEIAAPPGGGYGHALDAIFAARLAELVPSMPTFWQRYAREHLVEDAPVVGLAAAPAEDYTPESVETPGPESQKIGPGVKKMESPSSQAMRISGGVTAPVPIRMPEPKFSEEARWTKVNGNVLVYLCVDTAGRPTHIRVLRPLGLGLDEAAVGAVSQYLFKPSLRNGMPVVVEMNIEVNFQIF